MAYNPYAPISRTNQPPKGGSPPRTDGQLRFLWKQGWDTYRYLKNKGVWDAVHQLQNTEDPQRAVLNIVKRGIQAYKGRSAVQAQVARASIANAQAFFATEQDTLVITAGNHSATKELSDLSAKAAAMYSANDSKWVKFSTYIDTFSIWCSKPYVLIPFIVTGENSMTLTSTQSAANFDPETGIDSSVSDVEYRTILFPEIIPKRVMSNAVSFYIAEFEMNFAEIVNQAIIALESAQVTGFNEICKMGIWISGETSVTYYIDQISRRQYFDKIQTR